MWQEINLTNDTNIILALDKSSLRGIDVFMYLVLNFLVVVVSNLGLVTLGSTIRLRIEIRAVIGDGEAVDCQGS